MEEKALLKLWNEKRMQIIASQIAPSLVLISIFVLASQGTFASAGDAAKYLAVSVAAVTGFLSLVSQYAAIREAQALVVDLSGIKESAALSKKIASSKQFLNLTAMAIVSFGLATFALVVWAVLG